MQQLIDLSKLIVMKRMNQFIFLLSITAFTGIFSSCTKNFDELNVSPTQPNTVPAEYLFSQALLSGITAESNPLQVGSWIQHWASGNLVGPSQYLEDRDIYETRSWAAHYALINNLRQIQDKILKGEEATPTGRTKLAIAKIYEIFIWQRMTDFWGDIPYTEAGLPESEIILTPVYDKQEDIYKSLLSSLDGAMAQLNGQDISYGDADFVYKGKADSWRKFGNALKLRMGMRLRYVDEALSRKTVEEALSGPIFQSNADNALLPTVPQDGNSLGFHPVVSAYNASKELRQLANTLIDTLLAKNDPRLPRIAEPTENSKKNNNPLYRGLGVALGPNVTVNRDDYSYGTISIYGDRKFTFPYLFLSYSDVCFYKAEAALLGWAGLTADQANEFYEEGIRAAMQTDPYNIDNAAITSYLAAEGVLSGSPEEKLEQIMVQKWISLFMRDYEAYAEWRRTGYPQLVPGPNKGSTDGQIPLRGVYSGNERFRNPDQYSAAAQRLSNGDTYLSKVWWDTK